MSNNDRYADDNAQLPVPRQPGEEKTIADNALLSAILARVGLGKTTIPKDAPQASLLSFLQSVQWEERVAAARQLGKLGEPESVKSLVTALQEDPNSAVKAAAARALGDLSDYAPAEPLVAALDDTDEGVRTAAVWALREVALCGRLPDDTVENLVQASLDADENVRAAAVQTLGELGEHAPIERLIQALEDTKSAHVREVAAIALGEQRDSIAGDALVVALQKEKEQAVREALLWALDQISSVSRPVDEVKNETSKTPPGGSTPLSGPTSSVPTTSRITGTERRPGDQSESSGSGPPTNTVPRTVGNIVQLTPPQLSSVPVLSQALDNQWLPDSISLTLKSGIAYEEVKRYLDFLARIEYKRSLIAGRQIVINRAFFYNSSVLKQDFLPGSPDREAFISLVNEGVIVPFLYTEKAPDEVPDFGKPGSGIDPKGFAAWEQVCKEALVHCLRFSWNDDKNQRTALATLAREFHSFAQRLATNSMDRYLVDLGVDKRYREDLRKRFLEIARLCFEIMMEGEGKLLNRSKLYEHFVTLGDPSERRYDTKKAFAMEIKQLADLAYNAYAADAFGGYLLTPKGSPSRLVLQEWEHIGRQRDTIDAEQVASMLKRDVFAIVQGGLYLKSIGDLRLQDIYTIRMTQAWEDYITSLEKLLAQPALFEQYASMVYLNYVKLAAEMTQRADKAQQAAWNPSAKLVIDVGGATLTIVWTENGMGYTFGKQETPIYDPDGDAPFVARLILDDGKPSRSQANLFNSIDFMKGTMRDAVHQWEEVKRKVSEIWMAQELSPGQMKGTTGPTLNAPS